MKSMRKLNRRSFLARVAGGAVLAGGSLGTIARAQTGLTDQDPNDPVGNGRGGGTGVTDRDTGPGADPAGRGRGLTPPASQGVTDSDPSDPIGRGRGTRLTDSDRGPTADRPGEGRRGRQQAEIEAAARRQCEVDRQRLYQLEQEVGDPSRWTDAQLAQAGESLNQLYSIRQRSADINARQSQISQAEYNAAGNALYQEYLAVLQANNMGQVPIDAAINELTNRIRSAQGATTGRAERQYQIDLLRESIRNRNCP